MNINMKTVKSKFLHRAQVLVNAYKCAKFKLPSSNSYGDMEGSKKIGAADLLRRGQIITCSHKKPPNGYQRTKFQLSRWISFGDMRGSQNWELLISPDAH